MYYYNNKRIKKIKLE
ncbi:hypothetical protein [Clostridioides difficile]